MKKVIFSVLVVSLFLLQTCRYHLVKDATILRNKSLKEQQKTMQGKAVEGNTYYPYLIGYNLQDSMDEAFEQAGPGYDMLVNAKVDVKYYYVLIYFSKYVIVQGTAVKSKELKASMGEEAYQKWYAQQDVISR